MKGNLKAELVEPIVLGAIVQSAMLWWLYPPTRWNDKNPALFAIIGWPLQMSEEIAIGVLI